MQLHGVVHVELPLLEPPLEDPPELDPPELDPPLEPPELEPPPESSLEQATISATSALERTIKILFETIT